MERMEDEQVEEEEDILLVKDQEEPLLNIEEEEELISRPKKRVGRPPKEWSSILLPKEVTSTFGRKASTFDSKKKKKKKFKTTPNHDNMTIIPSLHKPSSLGNISTPPTICSPTLGQLVHGVVDGSFDAGFLVSLKLGNSDVLYHGVIFGPGMSIPLSNDTDIAKNVKWCRQRPQPNGVTLTTEEYSLIPQSPHAPNVHGNSKINGHLGVIHTTTPLPYNDLLNTQNVIRSHHHHHHRDVNVSPYVDASNSPHHTNVHVPPTREYYDSRQYIGNQMGTTNSRYGCTPSQGALQSKTFNTSTYIKETRRETM